jgi:flavin-dependent dehydrogenase
MRLRVGSRIAVIGGGPAGSFFAHFARNWADRLDLPVSLTIFDGKDFLARGPRGCNLCAGVIAGSLETRLRTEGLSLPEQRIISRVEGYALHVEDDILRLTCRENSNVPIATVFRGNGPRYASFPDVVSFDDYLLSWARDRGAEVISRPVMGIRPPSSPSHPLTVLYGDRHSPQRFEADLVVGAFGVNTRLIKEIQKLALGYFPPTTLITFQAEIKLGQEEVSRLFGNDIHVFLPPSRSIRYATIIPKKHYVTITVIGKKNATPEMAREFFDLETIRRLLPPSRPHCFCFPRIVVSAARRPFGDRLVLIGDAGFCRHYKNGIESAFHTARLAADAAFGHGIDAASLSTGYDRPARHLIARDNLYGRALFRLNDIISAVPLLSRTHLFLAQQSNDGAAGRKIRFILWNMFTGGIPYRKIFLSALDLRLQISLLRHTILLLFHRMKKALNDR